MNFSQNFRSSNKITKLFENKIISNMAWFNLTVIGTIFFIMMTILFKPSKGRYAQYNEFPMMAAVMVSDGKAPCGGVVIARSAIITAAHCFTAKDLKDPTHNVNILVGDVNLYGTRQARSRRLYNAKSIIRHPQYRPGHNWHDIAIVKVYTQFQFSESVHPAIIIERKPKTGDNCQVIGFGQKKIQVRGANIYLQVKTVQIGDANVCAGKLTEFDTHKMICGGALSAQDTSCQGDSGGPLLCHDELAGIVIFGRRCVTSEAAGGFIDIMHYEKWIKGHLPRAKHHHGHKFRTMKNGSGNLILKVWLFLLMIIKHIHL